MKSLILSIFILGSAFGAEHIQNFYVADSGFFVEGGYTTLNGLIEYDVPGVTDDRFSAQLYDVTGQYAFSKMLNIGAAFGRSKGGDYEGMEDYRFFVKGQKNIFFYGANFYYSPEDAEDDTSYSGGNHMSFEGGLFKKGFGAKFLFQPQYSIEDKDSDADKAGEEITLEAFYEKQVKNHIVGAGIGQYMIDGIKENNTEDTTYAYLKGYAAIDLDQVTLLPRLTFYTATEKPDLIDEINFTQLELRARFNF